jgi:hypothetical protein
MTVNRLLKKVVYAGYVEAPKWGVNVRQGHHEGLIVNRHPILTLYRHPILTPLVLSWPGAA